MIPIVYTLEVCPNCEKLKAALEEAGIEFEERDMQTRDSWLISGAGHVLPRKLRYC